MKKIVAALAFTVLSGTGFAQTSTQINASDIPIIRQSGAAVRVLKYGPVRIHAFTSPSAVGGNSTYIIEGKEKLVIIDAQWLAQFAKDFRDYIDKLGRPIDRVIITHAHLDHFYGLTAAFPDTPVYALPEVRRAIAEQTPVLFPLRKEAFGYGEYKEARQPNHDLKLGVQNIDGVQYQISSIAHGESEESAIIRLPSAGVIFTGDLIYNGFHLFLEKRDLSGWRVGLENLAAARAKAYFPGHGAPADQSTIAANLNYLSTAQKLLNSDTTAEAFKSKMISTFPKLQGQGFFDIYLPILFPKP